MSDNDKSHVTITYGDKTCTLSCLASTPATSLGNTVLLRRRLPQPTLLDASVLRVKAGAAPSPPMRSVTRSSCEHSPLQCVKFVGYLLSSCIMRFQLRSSVSGGVARRTSPCFFTSSFGKLLPLLESHATPATVYINSTLTHLTLRHPLKLMLRSLYSRICLRSGCI